MVYFLVWRLGYIRRIGITHLHRQVVEAVGIELWEAVEALRHLTVAGDTLGS